MCIGFGCYRSIKIHQKECSIYINMMISQLPSDQCSARENRLLPKKKCLLSSLLCYQQALFLLIKYIFIYVLSAFTITSFNLLSFNTSHQTSHQPGYCYTLYLCGKFVQSFLHYMRAIVKAKDSQFESLGTHQITL